MSEDTNACVRKRSWPVLRYCLLRNLSYRVRICTAGWKVLRSHVLRSFTIALYFIPHWSLPVDCPELLLAGGVVTRSCDVGNCARHAAATCIVRSLFETAPDH
jgi:hypothetical protein